MKDTTQKQLIEMASDAKYVGNKQVQTLLQKINVSVSQLKMFNASVLLIATNLGNALNYVDGYGMGIVNDLPMLSDKISRHQHLLFEQYLDLACLLEENGEKLQY